MQPTTEDDVKGNFLPEKLERVKDEAQGKSRGNEQKHKTAGGVQWPWGRVEGAESSLFQVETLHQDLKIASIKRRRRGVRWNGV